MSGASVLLGEIRPILETAEQGGLDVRALLARRGLDQAYVSKADTTAIPIADYFRIQRDIAQFSDDLTATLSSRKLTYKTGQYIVTQMQQARTLLEAIESLVEHFNMMHGDAYNSLRFSENRVSLVVDDSSFPYRFKDNKPLVELIGECLLIKTHCLLDSLSHGGADAAIKRVRLKRKRGENIQRQNRYWQVPLDYGCPAYELVYDYDAVCQRMRIDDQIDLSTEGLFSRVITYLENRQPADEHVSVTSRTLDLIDGGHTSQADIARHLDISVATLRRRLTEEGSNFRDLLLDNRLRRAEAMLMRGYSVAQTTEHLAYSDIRAFNRAFKRWKGQTPAAFARSFES